RKYGELLTLFAECGENWAECKISSTTSTDDATSVQGGQIYKRYKDLVAEHGKENADRLRAEKKAKQAALGNAYENVPWWYTHPDFADLEDYELYLVWDEAKVCTPSQLADGYISQIQHYRTPVDAAIEALDWKMISGFKDEATLDPLAKKLDKAIEDYNNALKPVKALFEISYASAQRVAHAAVEAERGMLPIGIHGDDFRYTEHGQKLVLVSLNVLVDNKMQDKTNVRLSIAHSEFMEWYWLNEFFNRMEKHGRFLDTAAKVELEDACAFQEAVFMAAMDGTMVV
ncbi:unnamed protein product, partial [Symbiodinium necroappetens]